MTAAPAATLSPNRRLRRINLALSAVVVLLALYVVLLPFLPEVGWWLQHSAPVVGHPISAKVVTEPSTFVPSDNRVIIPAIGLDQQLVQGTSPNTINLGVWLRPNASQPDKGGNTVLAGHRFSYTAPKGPFYFLDKIALDDMVTVFWQHKIYDYRVRSISVVPPTDLAVEGPSKQPILTMYTCTPLWSLTSRLVVVSSLVDKR